jgi:hypothetical protein
MRKLILNLSLIIILLSNAYCANNLIVNYKNSDGSQVKIKCFDFVQNGHYGNLIFFLNEYWTFGFTALLVHYRKAGDKLCYEQK